MSRIPHPWHPRRQHRLQSFLRATLVLALATAVLALALPPGAGTVAGWVAVGVLVAAPLVRVGWLGIRWWRKGDRRFAVAAAGLLGVVAVGTAVSFALA